MKEKPSYYAILTADVRYDKRLNANSKLLYAEITALSEKNGVCWAGDSYFSKLYEVTPRTVQRWLNDLEKYNYIKRDVVYKDDSKEVEKRYITIVKEVVTKMSVPYRQKCQGGMDKNVVDSTTSINTTSTNEVHVQNEELFNEFWEKYPRKINKKKAKDKYVKSVDEETHKKIIKDLEVRKNSNFWEDEQYIPHPTTYLNGERWNDEIETNANTSIYDTPIL